MTGPDITAAAVREAGLTVPSDQVPAIVAELGLSDTVEDLALEYCRAFQFSQAASGRSPSGIAAAAVYVASVVADEEITQEAIADTAGISTAPVGNIYPVIIRQVVEPRGEPVVSRAHGESASTDAP